MNASDRHTGTYCYRCVVLLAPFILLLLGWLPNCYLTYNNILPTPIVLPNMCIFVTPDSVEYR